LCDATAAGERLAEASRAQPARDAESNQPLAGHAFADAEDVNAAANWRIRAPAGRQAAAAEPSLSGIKAPNNDSSA